MIEKKYCTGCTACYAVCPVQAIQMKADKEGFLYPEIDEKKCIHCSKCEKVCPAQKKVRVLKEGFPIPYAAYSTEEEVQEQSSSGGVFTELARQVIRQEGIVVGCAMSDDCKKAEHIMVDNEKDLAKLRGSKYVQSDLQDVFLLTKQYLETGKPVLFSGTPCQTAGVKIYLGKEYEKLITVDLICHGVPSPLVWRKYADFHEKKAESEAAHVFFRNKKNGWRTFSMRFEFLNQKEYTEIVSKDWYLRGFVGNLYLRPSCYQCNFKGENYAGDITLADFWSIREVMPEMCNEKGTSLVVVHTEKGKEVLDELGNQIKKEQVDTEKVLKNHFSYSHSVRKNHLRSKFFRDIQTMQIDQAIEKYCGMSVAARARRLIYNRIGGTICSKIKHY